VAASFSSAGTNSHKSSTEAIIINKWLTISFLMLFGLTHRDVIADDVPPSASDKSATIAEAHELMLAAQSRRDQILKGIRLKWVHQFGYCKGPNQALTEGFDPNSPIATAFCRWLSNDRTFFHAAKGEPSTEGEDRQEDRLFSISTNYVGYLLATSDSRFHASMRKEGSKPNSWSGTVEHRENGFTRTSLYIKAPIDASGSGMTGLAALLSHLPENARVSIANGVNESGIPSKILQIERPGSVNLDVKFYFDRQHFMVVQHEQTRAGKLMSKSVVLETMTVSDGNRKWVIPKVIVTSYLPLNPAPKNDEGNEQWVLQRDIFTLAKLEPVPLEEMVIDLQGAEPTLSLQGMLEGKRTRYPRSKLTGVQKISAQNLDEVVNGLFENAELKTE